MIFQQTWRQVLDGTKTQTRRLVKPQEWYSPVMDAIFTTQSGRLKWRVTDTYAVQPGRGKKAIWTDEHHKEIIFNMPTRFIDLFQTDPPRLNDTSNYHQVRIRITNIRREALTKISDVDVQAEGVALQAWAGDVFGEWQQNAGYAELWDGIHTKPGTRWEDNPDVWVLTFEVAHDLET